MCSKCANTATFLLYYPQKTPTNPNLGQTPAPTCTPVSRCRFINQFSIKVFVLTDIKDSGLNN